MNKLILLVVLFGVAAADKHCAGFAGLSAFCAVEAGKDCDADANGDVSAAEYKLASCNAFIKKQKDDTSSCWKWDSCLKEEANKKQEAKYAAFCPSEKAKCAGSDTSANCAAWAKAGECTANADWMLSKCSNSCCPVCTGDSLLKPGVCPKDADSGLCTANDNSKGVTCAEWAGEDPLNPDSECQKNPAYMNKHCMQSCCPACFLDKNKCPTTKQRCTNEWAAEFDVATLTFRDEDEQDENNANCKKWAAAGECAANSKWMMEFCSKDCCPVCIPKAPASAPTAAPAVPRVAYPYQGFSGFAAPIAAPNFGGYGAFGGYGGALGALPYRG